MSLNSNKGAEVNEIKMVENYYVTKNSAARSRERARVILGAGHGRRETGGHDHHQPGPACGEL